MKEKKNRKEKKITKMTKKFVHGTTNFFGITTDRTPSRFVYKESKLYGILIFYIFISLISLLTLAPYAYYKVCEIRYNHTFIDNKKVVFRGKIADAYYQFALGLILVVISLFLVDIFKKYFLNDLLSNIPSPFDGLVSAAIAAAPAMIITALLFNRLFVWSIKNIFFVSDTNFVSYLKLSYLKLSIVKAVLSAILRKIAEFVSFGFGRPLLIVIKERYIVGRQYISQNKLIFLGRILSAYKWLFWRYLLIIPTFGFYYPIYLYKEWQWITIHTHIFKEEYKLKKFLII